ncbi:MAG: HD domain-containing protein [Geobacteraceae bacterium]|nr:HD domain-containing protein [Geobacteraceae bacterium]
MKQRELTLLREWFAGFCSSFHANDREEQRNIALKEEHTCHVCANIRRLAAEESLDEGGVALAEAVALFHDIGRFPQYRRHRTFRDSISVNHAVLGAEILLQGKVLDKFPCNEQDIIIQAVRHHNAFAVSAGVAGESAVHLRLVRDADKLDIWRVFLEFFALPEEERASAVGLGLPDLPGCSPEIIAALGRGELVRLDRVKSLNDFKLLQLSWVYDLNFPASFRMLVERDYINGLAAALPAGEEVRQAVAAVREFTLHAMEAGGASQGDGG